MISALAPLSGGHFNPAVSFGFFLTGRQSARSMLSFWAAQLLGAVVGSFFLRAVFPESVWDAVKLGAPAVHSSISPLGALVAEAIGTFFLVTAVWGTMVDDRHPPIGGFGVGLAVAMGVLAVGPVTGAAFNPARALGPALAANAWASHWLYWVGPLVGGGAAALAYDRFLSGSRSGRRKS